MSIIHEWPMVKLGDISQVVSGGTPKTSEPSFWDGDVPWITPADLGKNSGLAISGGEKFISQDGLKKSSAVLIPAGSVVLSSRAPIGHIAINTRPLATNQGCKSFVPTRDLDARYLAHYLIYIRGHLQQMGTGATFKELSRSRAQEIPVPLPPLPEQQRIAEILDTISSNLASRKTQLEQLSTLQKSTFERFHLAHLDQATKYHFKDVVPRIDSGKSPVCESRPAADNEWGVLKLSAVTTGEFLQDENKAYLEDTESLSHLEIQPGDLLMTRKNTPELVGAVSLVRETRPNLLLPDLIFRLNLNEDLVKPEYLAALLMSPPVRFSIRSLAGGSAKSMSNISKQRLNKLLIDLPPLNAQREFVTKSQEIQAIKRKVNSAYKLDQELLASLQAHAFAGHL